MEPDTGPSNNRPWDHDLSRNQELDTQPTEPPRCPYMIQLIWNDKGFRNGGQINSYQGWSTGGHGGNRLWLFFKNILFIYSWETQRGRQTHRQREKQVLCEEPDMGGLILRPQDHDLSQRQMLNHWATQAPLFLFSWCKVQWEAIHRLVNTIWLDLLQRSNSTF